MERTAGARARLAKGARALIVVALSAGYFGYVFQFQHGTWLTTGLGDWVDPYFINGLLEQWNYCVHHLKDPASLVMFHPARGTLGYSVGLILYAPFYIAVRPWLHPFAAYSLTLFVVMVAGVVCLYVVLRKFLDLGFLESLLLVAAFATSGNVINGWTGIWSQTASVFLIPPILLSGLSAARRPAGRLRLFGLGVAGLLAALLFTQDAYTALFAVLISALLLIGVKVCLGWPAIGVRARIYRRPAPILARARRIGAGAALGLMAIGAAWGWVSVRGSLLWIPFDSHHHQWQRPAAVALAALIAFVILRGGIRTRVQVSLARMPALTPGAIAVGIGALIGMLVFLHVYAGAFMEVYGFSNEFLTTALQNLTWSNWTEFPYKSARPFIFVLIVALLAWIPQFRVPRPQRLGVAWFGLVSVFVLLAAVRVNDLALWKLLTPFPGFSAIRDPKRIIYVYELAVALSAGVFLAQLPRQSFLRRAIGLALLVLLVTTWRQETFAYRRPMDVFDRYVASPIAIDPSCRSFFIKGASAEYMSRTDNMWSLYANDSVFIATRHGLPTLNGYSAWGPPGWDMANPQIPEYPDGVARWIALHDVHGVCALDIGARTMTPYTPPPQK